ncbi:MAG: YeeE/YedE family protein [Gammaproteobacteria bacterium]|nr:MAG: YeeE/YedE family protein [Gammaproteobacteria bacterium]
MELSNVQNVALWAFLVGAVFGAVANKTNFCTMGAISDWVNMGNKNRLRAWFLAIGVAVIGSQLLQSMTALDLGNSIYLTSNFGWLGHLAGGLIFGIGMTLASGCAQRTLVLVGSGNLKSLVVILVLAISAYMTLRGLIALFRINVIEVTNIDLTQMEIQNQGIATIIAAFTGIENVTMLTWVVAAIVGLGLIGFAFKSQQFRASFDNVLAGISIGIFVTAAWYITGIVGFDDFEPVPLESFTFIAPVGNSLQYLMTYTGSTINFGIAAVFGVIAGSFLYAITTGKFRIQTFISRSDMVAHLIGAALMGFGGVLSLGCTIGQGVTGMSTLALGSLITLGSIIFGSALTMKVQYYLMDDQSFLLALRSSLADMRLMPASR